MIDRRRMLIASQKKGRLPSEYQEVEYLKSSDGMQYINTGIVASSNIKMNFKIGDVLLPSFRLNTYGLTGSRRKQNNPTDSFFLLFRPTQAQIRFDFGGDNPFRSCAGYIQDDMEFTIENNVLTTDTGYSYIALNKTFTGYYPLILFGLQEGDPTSAISGGAITPLWGKIYYFNAEVGGQTYSFVPCYRKADSVAGMYDIDNDTFLTNQGTGTFIVGDPV